MSDWVRQIKKKWTLTASATPPKARRVSCRVKAMFMVLSLIVVGVGPASWFKALSRRCHSTWRFRANLRAFFPVLALHSGLNAPTEDDMLVFPLQYFMYSSRAVAVNVYSTGFSWWGSPNAKLTVPRIQCCRRGFFQLRMEPGLT